MHQNRSYLTLIHTLIRAVLHRKSSVQSRRHILQKALNHYDSQQLYTECIYPQSMLIRVTLLSHSALLTVLE